jgi:uncharacterized membrane protein YebE (DUF533 family)
VREIISHIKCEKEDQKVKRKRAFADSPVGWIAAGAAAGALLTSQRLRKSLAKWVGQGWEAALGTMEGWRKSPEQRGNAQPADADTSVQKRQEAGDEAQGIMDSREADLRMMDHALQEELQGLSQMGGQMTESTMLSVRLEPKQEEKGPFHGTE